MALNFLRRWLAGRNAVRERAPETVVGAGAVLDGTFEIEYGVRVEGTLQGPRLQTRQELVVGAEGLVRTASIEVGEAVVRGRIDGVLRARGQIHLCAGSRFRGVLETSRLVIEEGAVLEEDRSGVKREKMTA